MLSTFLLIIAILQLLVSAYTLVALLFSKPLTEEESTKLDYRS
jgi:hypothetical protein